MLREHPGASFHQLVDRPEEEIDDTTEHQVFLPGGKFLARGTNPHFLIASRDLPASRVAATLARILRALDKEKGSESYTHLARRLLFKSGLFAYPIFPHQVNHKSPYRIARPQERPAVLSFPY